MQGLLECRWCNRGNKRVLGDKGVIEMIKTELYNDNFQNYKRYGIQKAQLVIADIPYNIGNNLAI